MADETASVSASPCRTGGRRRARTAAAAVTPAEGTLEEQVAQLQKDIRAIGASLARLGDEKVSDARSTARSQYRNLLHSGQNVADEVSEQVSAYEGQLVEAIREKPLTAVLGAIGVGFLIALLSRR